MGTRRMLLSAALAMTAAATVACTSSIAGTASTSPVAPAPPQPTSSKNPRLKFPNTLHTVRLMGYDEAVRMVRFQVQVYQRLNPNNRRYEPDPADPAVHRLPLAPLPDIRSALTMCATSDGEITVDAQGNGSRPCTPEQLIDSLRAGVTPLAKLRTDSTDHIVALYELYEP